MGFNPWGELFFETIGAVLDLAQFLNVEDRRCNLSSRYGCAPSSTRRANSCTTFGSTNTSRPTWRRARLIEVRDKFAPKIAAELTPEQLPKFKKLHESLAGKPYDTPRDAPAPLAKSK